MVDFDDALLRLGVSSEETDHKKKSWVSTLVFLVREAKAILEQLAFDDDLSEDQRECAMFLLVHYAQFNSTEYCIDVISRFVIKYAESYDCELFDGMKETLAEQGFLGYIGT